MKCWHCDARNLRHSSTCWACGVQLRQRSQRSGPTYRPETMRHFTAGLAAMQQHRTWLDGLVLLTTLLFGILLGYVAVEVIPNAASGGMNVAAAFSSGPLGFLRPPRTLPLQPLGVAHEVNGVVTQVAEVRRSGVEAGQAAGAGRQFVTATVVIDNQEGAPLSYDLSDWSARDSRGRSIPAQAITRAGWLSGGRVAPGQQVLGAVSFLVPEGERALQITFSPRAFGAVVRWDASQPPE
jgi:hypothetical protein